MTLEKGQAILVKHEDQWVGAEVIRDVNRTGFLARIDVAGTPKAGIKYLMRNVMWKMLDD